VIKSFKDAEAARIFRREPSRRYATLQRIILKKLVLLETAQILDDVRNPPGNRLEALRGDRIGQYSIRVNDQYRICFRFEGGSAHDVEITDYH
jgi:toxin HigB-1